MIDTTPWDVFLGLVVVGACIGAFEHGVRTVCAPYAKALRSFGDVVFWACTTMGVFWYVYVHNDGDMRWYVFVAVAVGVVVYAFCMARTMAYVVWNPIAVVVHGTTAVTWRVVRWTSTTVKRMVLWTRGYIRDVRRSKVPPTMPKE